MAYSIGQELIFTSPNEKKGKVTILKRAINYKDGYIDEPNFKGDFDYFASVERNGQRSHLKRNL